MNLVQKYIKITMEQHDYRKKAQVMAHLNQELGTNYPTQSLYNWASEIRPRQVPEDIEQKMRAHVIQYYVETDGLQLTRGQIKKMMDTLNSECLSRQRAYEAIMTDNKIKLSAAKNREIKASLDTPFKKSR